MRNKRIEALDESKKFLSQDIKSFVDFFKKNTQESKNAMAEADAQKNIRVAMSKTLKEKEESCQKLVSNINKNIELLEEYYKYKEFLDRVSNPNGQNNNQDTDESSRQKQDSKSTDKGEEHKGTSQNKAKQKKRNDFLDEIKCSDELNRLIADDTFEYKTDFDNPDDLIKNFTALEEKNLFLIQQTQEAEQAYEEKNQELTRIKKKFDKEISGLQQGLNETNERIKKIRKEIDTESKGDNENKEMDPMIINRIKSKVKEVYMSIPNEGKGVESNNTTLYFLCEIEKKIEEYLQKIRIAESTFSESYVAEKQKTFMKERKDKKVKKNQEEKKILELKKKQEDMNKKNRAFEIHRPLMERSKPKIKKKIVKNNTQTEEDKDREFYLGLI